MPDSDTREVVYWDACVPLALINKEAGRVEHVSALMTDAGDGHISIVTSTLTVTEVASAATEKAAGALDDVAFAQIESLWTPASPIRLVEFHPGLARAARGLVRDSIARGWGRLTPIDAVHLATAQSMGVAKFHTYEDALERWGAVLGFTVEDPVSNRPELPLGQ